MKTVRFRENIIVSSIVVAVADDDKQRRFKHTERTSIPTRAYQKNILVCFQKRAFVSDKFLCADALTSAELLSRFRIQRRCAPAPRSHTRHGMYAIVAGCHMDLMRCVCKPQPMSSPYRAINAHKIVFRCLVDGNTFDRPEYEPRAFLNNFLFHGHRAFIEWPSHSIDRLLVACRLIVVCLLFFIFASGIAWTTTKKSTENRICISAICVLCVYVLCTRFIFHFFQTSRSSVCCVCGSLQRARKHCSRMQVRRSDFDKLQWKYRAWVFCYWWFSPIALLRNWSIIICERFLLLSPKSFENCVCFVVVYFGFMQTQ